MVRHGFDAVGKTWPVATLLLLYVHGFKRSHHRTEGDLCVLLKDLPSTLARGGVGKRICTPEYSNDVEGNPLCQPNSADPIRDLGSVM